MFASRSKLMMFALFSLVMMSCAPVQKTMLTKNSAPMLKGNWQGWTTFSVVPSNPILTTLQITNNAFPVEGNITLINLPDGVPFIFPADTKTPSDDVTIDFSNAMVTDQGTLLLRSGENFLELTYYTGEKPKLAGWFYYYYSKGTVELTKK